jgi:PiT family inorganic phosphate transporter
VAVGLAAVFNLVGAVVTVAFFQAKVSNTIASTLAIKPGLIVVMAALLGAITWNLVTWYRGLPSSSTHALIGGLCGAGIASAGGLRGVQWSSLGKQVASLVISPPLGFLAAGIFAVLLVLIVHRWKLRPGPVNRTFRSLQILTSALLSYSHGANDAQKTMAAITLALVAAGDLPRFEVPLWVVVLSAAAIGFGTYAGGWRIIRTLGWGIMKLEPATGMAAQLMGATVIQGATVVGLPVSTTHVITGAVMGVGASKKLSAVHWGVGANIVVAWVVTIPASAVIAWVAFAILHTAGLKG